ncbi:MAG: SDR family NAD(P)-dependent oxidoreductase [Bacteroidetes bacterium]|nr:SDR family NAD(P)-dependent oxidoreductase [Bacteroidota bacterium]MCB0843753.1 SDR family NAD(P)-dependent oxidoreductase [Bacteroidota bacterium]MCB0851048.1 SDR family NAD(P)-dependent oxidoreductase [Bacteroidota bacterium]
MAYSQENKTILITGATSGIGKEAACYLASLGAKVVASARNKEKGSDLLSAYKEQYPNGQGTIELVEGDFSSLQSIQNLCEQVKTSYPVIDTLINNAGVWKMSYQETKDGIEETWQVNVLAPMLITHSLIDLVKKSSDGRLVFTASGLHKGVVDLNNPEMRQSFSGMKSYQQSKLADILLTRWLASKLEDTGIGAYCFHPGFVGTSIGRDGGMIMQKLMKLAGMSPKKGAETLNFLATEPQENLVSGEYYVKKKVKKITAESNDMEMANGMIEKGQTFLADYIQSDLFADLVVNT